MPRHLLLTALAFVAMAQTAAAHPHVFVDAVVGFDVEEGRLTSLHISWTYDEFTTLTMFDVLDLDRDGDGVLDADDLDKVVEGETEWPDDYNGDIYLEHNGEPLPLARPVNGSAEMQDDRITVHFNLPLTEPLDPGGSRVVLRLYDPFYFHAYTVTGVRDAGVLKGECTASFTPFQPDAAAAELQAQLAALSREETPDQAGVGRLFSDEVVLSCE